MTTKFRLCSNGQEFMTVDAPMIFEGVSIVRVGERVFIRQMQKLVIDDVRHVIFSEFEVWSVSQAQKDESDGQ